MSVNRSTPIEFMPAALMRTAGVAAILFFASAALGVDETVPVQKPDVKVGDRWRYRVLTHQKNVPTSTLLETRVSFVGPDVIVNVEAEDNSREYDSHFGTDWSMHSLGSVGQTFDPPLRILKFPLQAGAEFPYAFSMVAQRGTAARVSGEGAVTVVGWEDIVVPAGKFRALKVEAKGSFRRLDVAFAGWQRNVIWYAPEVKRWVKSTFERGGQGPTQLERIQEVELVDFKVQ